MSKAPKPIDLEQSAQHGCGDLLEVVLFAPQGSNERDFLLGADVRFGTMVVASEDWTKSVEIGLSKATLGLDLIGCEIDASVHRFGDKKPASTKTQVQRTQIASASSQVGGHASLGASAKSAAMGAATADVRAESGLAKSRKTSSTATQMIETHEDPVIALSGNRWRFSSVSDTFMESRYSGSEALCKLKVTAPSIKVEGKLSFQPKNIVIVDVECTSTSLLDSLRKSPNKLAIAKVLLSKHLKEINPLLEKTSGSIVGWISNLKGDL